MALTDVTRRYECATSHGDNCAVMVRSSHVYPYEGCMALYAELMLQGSWLSQATIMAIHTPSYSISVI
jgi:hypothetical protein